VSLTLDLDRPTEYLRIEPWPDPVIDSLGHDVRSAYVERFWLPILGPSTTLLLRRIATELDTRPDGFELPLLDTAHALGLGTRGGRNAPFLRAIARAGTFHLAQPSGPGCLAVRQRVQPLTRVQVERLPDAVRTEHDQWQRASERSPSLEQQRRRARRLALGLIELGEDAESVEHQLHRWQIHPALAHDALRWARERSAMAAGQAAQAPVPDPPALVS
jgi:hypothetical protein